MANCSAYDKYFVMKFSLIYISSVKKEIVSHVQVGKW
jgi:hypothetical protein